MTKRELIDEIVMLNQTAEPGFLSRFDDEDLSEYLRHLKIARQPRLTSRTGRYDKYFRSFVGPVASRRGTASDGNYLPVPAAAGAWRGESATSQPAPVELETDLEVLERDRSSRRYAEAVQNLAGDYEDEAAAYREPAAYREAVEESGVEESGVEEEAPATGREDPDLPDPADADASADQEPQAQAEDDPDAAARLVESPEATEAEKDRLAEEDLDLAIENDARSLRAARPPESPQATRPGKSPQANGPDEPPQAARPGKSPRATRPGEVMAGKQPAASEEEIEQSDPAEWDDSGPKGTAPAARGKAPPQPQVVVLRVKPRPAVPKGPAQPLAENGGGDSLERVGADRAPSPQPSPGHAKGRRDKSDTWLL